MFKLDKQSQDYIKALSPLFWREFQSWVGEVKVKPLITYLAISFFGAMLLLSFGEGIILLDEFKLRTAGTIGLVVIFLYLAFVSFIVANINLHRNLKVRYESVRLLLELKESEFLRLEEETVKSAEQKPLNLYVSWGKNVYENSSGSDVRVELTLDVINSGTRKIIDLEAYFRIVYQSIESYPDDWSKINSFSSFVDSKLEWKDGKYSVDLIPGFPGTYVKVVGLDWSKPEMAFVHEGIVRKIREFEQDAIYRIIVEFKGKLEGNDPDYKFLFHEAYFVCSPKNSQLGGWIREKDNLNLPEWMRNRIDITLKDRNWSRDD